MVTVAGSGPGDADICAFCRVSSSSSKIKPFAGLWGTAGRPWPRCPADRGRTCLAITRLRVAGARRPPGPPAAREPPVCLPSSHLWQARQDPICAYPRRGLRLIEHYLKSVDFQRRREDNSSSPILREGACWVRVSLNTGSSGGQKAGPPVG